jgi:hypothetical protein
MAKGFDCATPLTAETAASFRANGYEFVARYLVPPDKYRKALTKAEADLIQAAGLKIVSVFETTADRALAGYQAGLRDGLTAKQCAADVGQPTLQEEPQSTIYFAVDFDPTDEQMPTVMEYLRGANDATPEYATGDYGSYAVVMAAKASGVASHHWQTYAWSGGRLADCQVYQYQNGAEYDEDKSFGCEGWWGKAPSSQPVAAVTKLDPGVALTILNTWMKPAWKAADDQYQDTQNKAWQDQANYIAWLGKQLRQAGGLPEEE